VGWLEGWLTGFHGRHREIEQENLALAQQASEREGKIYEALLNAPDPKVRGYAATGLLQSTQPRQRKGGLAGWAGEMESSPIYPTLMKYLNTPQLQGYEDVPGTAVNMTARQAGYLPRPPETAAMSATQTTAPGQPGPAATFTEPPPPPGTGIIGREVGSSSTDVWTPERTRITEQLEPPTAEGVGGRYRDERGQEWGRGPGGQPVKLLAVPPPPPTPLGRTPGTPAALGELQVKAQLGEGMEPEPLNVPAQQRAIYGLPRAFPTTEDTQIAAAGAKVTGEIQALARTYKIIDPTISDADATKRAAAQYERERLRNTSAPFKTYPIEYTDPTSGTPVQTMGTYDNQTGTWRDAQMRPILGNVSRIQPEQMGTWGTLALGNLGYRRLADVPLDKRDDVVAESMRLREEAALRTGTGAAQAKFQAPMTAPQAQAAQVPVGTTSAQLTGQNIATTQQADRRRTIETIREQLDTIEQKLGVLPSQNELAGMAPGAVMAVRRRRADWKPAIADLDASVDEIVNALARSVGEQRGTQTEMDAERAYNTIVQARTSWRDPLGGDTRESALARIQQTRAYLDTVLKRLPAPAVPQVAPAAPQVATPPPAPGAGAGAGVTPPITPTAAPTGGETPPPGIEWWTSPSGRVYHNGTPIG
jgi:hypothetical protein